jgi:hypothetical protein
MGGVSFCATASFAAMPDWCMIFSGYGLRVLSKKVFSSRFLPFRHKILNISKMCFTLEKVYSLLTLNPAGYEQ